MGKGIVVIDGVRKGADLFGRLSTGLVKKKKGTIVYTDP